MEIVLKEVSDRQLATFLVGVWVIFLVVFSMIAIYELSGADGTYVIRINEEAWYVTGNRAEREFSYSGTFYSVPASRNILYPGQSTDRKLEINLRTTSGLVDFTVESFGVILLDVKGVSEINITLSIEHNSVRYSHSPHTNNVTFDGYILAYCSV